jgi:pyruvate-formate lyase-activating enzyme
MYTLGQPTDRSHGAGIYQPADVLGTAFHNDIVRATLGRTPIGFLSLRHKFSRRLVHKGLHFFFAAHALRRVANFVIYLTERKRRSRVHYLPPLVFLDPTVSCNLRCPGCATGLRLTRSAPKASLAGMKRVIDQVCPTAAQLAFYHWGEPFLNDDVFEAIRYARSNGLWTVVSSHLSLRKPRLAQQIVESGLHDLIVSCDGASQETYQRYRRGGEIGLVWSNLEQIRKERDRLRRRAPFIRAKMIVFEHNWHEARRFETLAREKGADEVQFAFGNGDRMFRVGIVASGSQFDVVDLSWKEKKPGGACEEIWQAMYVTPDNGTLSCCMGHADSHLFIPPANRLNIAQAWNSPAYVSARDYFLGRIGAEHMPGGCRSCEFVTRFKTNDRGHGQ